MAEMKESWQFEALSCFNLPSLSEGRARTGPGRAVDAGSGPSSQAEGLISAQARPVLVGGGKEEGGEVEMGLGAVLLRLPVESAAPRPAFRIATGLRVRRGSEATAGRWRGRRRVTRGM